VTVFSGHGIANGVARSNADGMASTALTLGNSSEVPSMESPFAANVNYLAQHPAQVWSQPLVSGGRLPNQETWEVAARAYLQLAQEWPQGAIQIDSARLNEITQSVDALANALQSVNMQKHGAEKVPARTQRVPKTGWYALEVAVNSAQRGAVDVEFMPDNKAKPEVYTLENSGEGGQQAAWIHFKEPGSLIVRARGTEETAIRGMDWPEFLSRWRDSTWQRGFLTVTLLNDVLPLMAYILVVCIIRFLAYSLIGKLPRAVRTRATEEVDLMPAFAKWSGVGCYTLWTAKDVLAGIGIVFVK